MATYKVTAFDFVYVMVSSLKCQGEYCTLIRGGYDMVNADFRIAIIRRCRSQVGLSHITKIPENRISHFVNGWALPNPREREILERELGADLVDKLFTEGNDDQRTKPAA